MTYYPGGHDVLLFGGYGEIGDAPFTFYQDTWTYANNAWKEAVSNKSCTLSTCPSPRAGAMVTYYPPDHAVLLFGGYVYSPSITYIPFDDTWLFDKGAWHNITASAGPAPSPRFEGSMVWDSLDNYALLFGGSNATGASFGDTWAFNGTWHNISLSESLSPDPRAGAALANSPSGYILLFGGAENGVILSDELSCSYSVVAWWFYAGQWQQMPLSPVCVAGPLVGPPSASSITGTIPPCGRVNPALGWSPKNNHFVLYGGIGPEIQTTSNCSGFSGFLNDTWLYANPPGGGFNFENLSDSGDPSARYEMGYASDFTDNYFEIFGGWNGTDGGLNDTWRFNALLHAQLTGPSNIDTSGAITFNVPFTVTGFGGTGDLGYSFSIVSVKSGDSNTLSGTGCAILTGTGSGTLSDDGQAQASCQPLPTSYNYYRLTVYVADLGNVSRPFVTANWSFEVSPPETLAIYSQYSGYFYSGISLSNNFGVIAVVAGAPATGLTATFGGFPIAFTERSGSPNWWDAEEANMGLFAAGPEVLQVTAQFADNWQLNATYTVNVIETPDWLTSLLLFPEITQKITSTGSGPYNLSYSVSESFQWSLDKALGFNIAIPLAGGNYSLIPAISVTLVATSQGNLSLTGSLSLQTGTISIGPASLSITAAISLQGSFSLETLGGQIDGVQWDSAYASISVNGNFSGSVPIYGFSVLGVSVGFTLEISVNPTITLGLLLMPTTPGFDEFIQGIQVRIQQFIGSFTLPLSVAVKFSIGIASVEVGGTISVAVTFATNTGLYLSGGWVNGSIFIGASAFWWSATWNLVSGTIYHWSNPVPPASARGGLSPGGYDNGTNTTWVLHSRYYSSAGYDANVWSPGSTTGPAVSDLYPYTALSAAGAANGAYVFYTNDNLSQPVQNGIEVSGLHLNSSSNALTAAPVPSDPNYLISSPQATTLADGDLYVLWDALPIAEANVPSPLDLTTVALHGAIYYPGNNTWGPIHAWTSEGLAESYLVDATASAPKIAVLVSNNFLLGNSTPERLEVFNVTSGAEAANSSIVGLSNLISLRAGADLAVVRDVGGNYSLISLASGTLTAVPYTSPIGGSLVSAQYATGSSSTLVLLYRGQNTSLLVLYDLTTQTAIATLPLSADSFDAEAVAGGATYYAFIRTSTGIEGWTESGATFTNLTNVTEHGMVSYSTVQFGGGILLYSLVARGNSTEPTVSLFLSEVGADLSPITSSTPSTATTTSSSGPSNSTYLLYLAIAAGAVVVLLAVVAILTRRPPRPPRPEDRSPGAPPSGATGESEQTTGGPPPASGGG